MTVSFHVRKVKRNIDFEAEIERRLSFKTDHLWLKRFRCHFTDVINDIDGFVLTPIDPRD